MCIGAPPEFIEGDVFQIVIPLTVGAMTKVGLTTSPVTSGEVSVEDGGYVSEHVGDHVGEHVSEQVEDVPLFIHLEPEKMMRS